MFLIWALFSTSFWSSWWDWKRGCCRWEPGSSLLSYPAGCGAAGPTGAHGPRTSRSPRPERKPCAPCGRSGSPRSWSSGSGELCCQSWFPRGCKTPSPEDAGGLPLATTQQMPAPIRLQLLQRPAGPLMVFPAFPVIQSGRSAPCGCVLGSSERGKSFWEKRLFSVEQESTASGREEVKARLDLMLHRVPLTVSWRRSELWVLFFLTVAPPPLRAPLFCA